MNKEDYSKYYIQGSDHYLIPKDVFDELFDEMENWKEESKELNQKYLNAVADYETTMSELQELKKQLTTYQILHRDCKIDNLKNISKIEEKETQQKEFINYMNKTIEELECDDVDDEEMKGYLIQRIDIFKEILKKYNEKVTDINVGNIGDERNEKINGLE